MITRTGLLTFVAAAGIVFAQDAPLRVMTSNGVKPAMVELFAQSEHATGRRITSEFNTSVALKTKIETEGAFDVAILSTSTLDDLIKQGKIAADSRIEVARAGIGLGYHKGAPKPDISTAEALKKTLLNAKSVTFADTGASRQSIEEMFVMLGIADQMKIKTMLGHDSGQPQMDVAAGKAELVLTLMPEMPPYKGVAVAGPLPAEFQVYTSFAAGISTSTKNKDAALALVKFVTGAQARAELKAKGLETK
jgi:molybdate transport system substrate-binding protein